MLVIYRLCFPLFFRIQSYIELDFMFHTYSNGSYCFIEEAGGGGGG